MQFKLDHSFVSDGRGAGSSIRVPHVPPGLYLVTLKLDITSDYNEGGATEPLGCSVRIFDRLLGGAAAGSFSNFWFAQQILVTDAAPVMQITLAGEEGIEAYANATAYVCVEKLSP